MGNQDDRLGSLLVFNDLALVLSTYGVLVLFNYLVEPINSNTWIVCTFFVGIKILIVGIADITGIGKNYFVSLLFVLVADGIIILINQLMAFGLSLRLMLIMVIADLICVFLALFIWKRFGKESVESYSDDDWIYSDEPKKPQVAPEPVEAPQTTETPEVESLPEENDVIFDFQNLEKETATQEIPEKPIFDNFSSEPVTQGDDILNFDELTQELPSEDEIQKAMEQAQEDEAISSSFNYFDGLDIFIEIDKEEPPTEEPVSFTTAETEEAVEEPVEITKTEEPEQETETEIFTEESIEEVKEETTPIEIKIIEEAKPEEEIPFIEEIPTTETEEVEIQEETLEVEPPVEPTIIEENPEEVIEESKEETSSELEQETEEVIPEHLIEPYIFKIPEEEEEEEYIPFFVQSANDYNRITRSTIGFTNRFSMIPVNVSQDQIDTYREEVKEEIKKLNGNMDILAQEYNNSLSPGDISDQIKDYSQLSEDFSVSEGEQTLRENLNRLTEKEFISDQVVNTLLELISKLDNRIYNINFAEENLKERLRRDQELELERQRKRKEAEEKARLAQERERARKEAEAKVQEKAKTQPQPEKPTTSTNEVLLQNGDMDIIIDAADLELLKEFLQQQDNK